MSPWPVPVLAQTTAALCWEACARIMWQWRHKTLVGYPLRAGNYLRMTTGLTQAQMNSFYTQLGMRGLASPKGSNLKHALTWSPVIFTDINKTTGHAMVLSGFSSGKYTVVNPCAVQSIDFDTGANTCQAGVLKRAAKDVEGPLGAVMWYW
jgi:hypothetical protein